MGLSHVIDTNVQRHGAGAGVGEVDGRSTCGATGHNRGRTCINVNRQRDIGVVINGDGGAFGQINRQCALEVNTESEINHGVGRQQHQQPPYPWTEQRD